LFVVHLKWGIEGIFLSNVFSSGLTLLILLPLVLRRLVFKYSRGDLRELLAFGLPYMPSTLSVVIMDTIDRPLLERLAGVDVAGLYGTGARLAMLMALIVAAFRFAWHPFFLSTAKQTDAKEIFSKVFTYVLFACTFLFLFVSLFIDDIVRIRIGQFTLFGPDYWDSTVVVPVIMLAYIFNAAYVNFIIGIYLKKKTKYLPCITGVGMIANLLTNFILIPKIGMMGAAWARVVPYVIMAVTLYFVNQRLYKTRYEFGRILKMIVVAALLFFIATEIPLPFDFISRIILLLAFPLLLWMAGFFEKKEITKIVRLVSNVR
jgi:O-antigen/teichoic acid export membrane protein